MSRKKRTEEISRVADTSGVKIPRIRQSTQFLMDTLMADKAYRFIDKTSQFLLQAHNLAEDAREEIAKINPLSNRRKLEEELKDIFESQPYYSAAYWVKGGRAVIAHHKAIPEQKTGNLLDELDNGSADIVRQLIAQEGDAHLQGISGN